MTDESVLQTLPLFSGLEPEEIRELTASLRRRRFARNEVIFHREDPGNCLFAVLSGAVKIALTSPDGKEVILAINGPGDSFGELALFDGEPRSADAVALEPTELLAVPRDTFLQFLRNNPDATLRVLASMARQFRRLTDTVHDSVFLDVPGRLAGTLLQLMDPGDGATREVTQGDLAALIGATRESVNKWLGAFERMGLIARERGKVRVIDPAGLRRRAQ